MDGIDESTGFAPKARRVGRNFSRSRQESAMVEHGDAVEMHCCSSDKTRRQHSRVHTREYPSWRIVSKLLTLTQPNEGGENWKDDPHESRFVPNMDKKKRAG